MDFMVNRKNRIRKFVALILPVVLTVSITLNIVLYNELMDYYKALYSVSLDPLGLSYVQDNTNQLASDKPIVIFYGDSRAAQWIAPQTDDYVFINRGIGNQTSTQVLLRFEEHVQLLQPDAIIVQVCVNDLKTIPLFPQRKDDIIGACKANIESIVQKSLELDATIILTTVFPTSGNVPLTRRLVWSDDVDDAIGEVNNFIRNYQPDNVIIFDAAVILSNEDGYTRSEYVYDLLHLNRAGYDALNIDLTKILDGLKITNH